jgi:hypothetical protein
MTPEEGKNLRIVAEVMEVELCEGCGVDTEGDNVRTEGPDGSLERLLCNMCAVKEAIERFSVENVQAARTVVDSLSAHEAGARKSAGDARRAGR